MINITFAKSTAKSREKPPSAPKNEITRKYQEAG